MSGILEYVIFAFGAVVSITLAVGLYTYYDLEKQSQNDNQQ